MKTEENTRKGRWKFQSAQYFGKRILLIADSCFHDTLSRQIGLDGPWVTEGTFCHIGNVPFSERPVRRSQTFPNTV